ncbi:hypothetical protein VP381E491_P0010 [Vibrio phage 381E49-1]|nr:hypothetical protein VP381E491_P0010 [Vibrio phage 381E49-1]
MSSENAKKYYRREMDRVEKELERLMFTLSCAGYSLNVEKLQGKTMETTDGDMAATRNRFKLSATKSTNEVL